MWLKRKEKLLKKYAAAHLPKTHKAEAISYVNSLSSGDEFFNALVDERAWEFAGEAIRKWDLIRWGLLSQKIEEAKAAYKELIKVAPKSYTIK